MSDHDYICCSINVRYIDVQDDPPDLCVVVPPGAAEVGEGEGEADPHPQEEGGRDPSYYADEQAGHSVGWRPRSLALHVLRTTGGAEA